MSHLHPRAVVLDALPLKAVEPTDKTLAAADCDLIPTDHPEFDYRRIIEIASLIIDTRNAPWGIPAPEGRIVTL